VTQFTWQAYSMNSEGWDGQLGNIATHVVA